MTIELKTTPPPYQLKEGDRCVLAKAMGPGWERHGDYVTIVEVRGDTAVSSRGGGRLPPERQWNCLGR